MLGASESLWEDKVKDRHIISAIPSRTGASTFDIGDKSGIG
jgi:hypothetical protein